MTELTARGLETYFDELRSQGVTPIHDWRRVTQCPYCGGWNPSIPRDQLPEGTRYCTSAHVSHTIGGPPVT